MYANLETERLLLRPIQIQDCDFILQLVNSKSWLQYIGDRKIKNIADSEQYIRNITNNTKQFYTVIVQKNTLKQLGIVTFLYRDSLPHPDIGFALLAEYENRGYAFEATKSYLDYLFQNHIILKVMAISIPKNSKSIRLLGKLGFVFKETIQKDGDMLSVFETGHLC